MQNQCAEIKIRAERRAGELLKDTVRHQGGNPQLSDDATVGKTLPESISRDQSSRWQEVASVSEEKLDKHIEQVKAQGEELTTAEVLRVSPRHQVPVK